MSRGSRSMFLATACGAAVVVAAVALAAAPPNILFLLTDDLGYGDLGCYGATDLRTPHIDRLAAEGMRCTDFTVTAPLCTPSRVSFFTGRYPGRAGLATGVLRPDATNGLPASEFTIAEVLKPLGYATGYIGKWHLGSRPGLRPRDQGFDEYFGVPHNLDRFETVCFEAEGGPPVLRNDDVVLRPAVPAALTALYTREALDFIGRRRAGPFFLVVSYQMPHIPFDASPRFRGRSGRGLYGDAIEELDWSAGEIRAALEAAGLASNSIVMFTSDNGPERGTPGSAGPFRGTKHTVYEGGLRVPFIAWAPGRIPAGRVCAEPTSALDLVPTLVALAGAVLPNDRVIDGRDMSAVWLGRVEGRSAPRTLFALYGFGEQRLASVRDGPWKLVRRRDGSAELYRLDRDPAESQDLAAHEPARVAALLERLEQWRRETGTP